MDFILRELLYFVNEKFSYSLYTHIRAYNWILHIQLHMDLHTRIIPCHTIKTFFERITYPIWINTFDRRLLTKIFEAETEAFGTATRENYIPRKIFELKVERCFSLTKLWKIEDKKLGRQREVFSHAGHHNDQEKYNGYLENLKRSNVRTNSAIATELKNTCKMINTTFQGDWYW